MLPPLFYMSAMEYHESLFLYPCFYIMTRCDWHNSTQRDSDIRPFFSCSVTFGSIERDKEIHPFFLLIIYFISHYYLFRIMKLFEVELFNYFLDFYYVFYEKHLRNNSVDALVRRISASYTLVSIG